ncbi:MAG: hypothetical protein K0R93_1842 [Anaerosolibacter sp.]|jgi:spore maturation protein CgeB|uniref:glycosyltransferase family protein n=1 Tax=Anaerosolibacter sp. TaxID=1872527 RepID=UPI00261B6049|nr:glycosyltransferase [Anaerosolibacter sp.]MDF2546944.1 hypothetical protein [Anaerosolibacter sp.]
MIINLETGKQLKIASILDKFGDEWIKHECQLIPLPIINWKTIIENNGTDLLLVQSAWQGNNGTWKYRITNLQSRPNDLALRNIVKWCKKHEIPTAFWNIEDPYHFETFLEAARQFDYIFTTDINSIPRYISLLGHNNVFLLPFGVQPRLHNPINKDKEKFSPIGFSGTWHRNGHEARKQDMKIILEPALKYGVHIYDRMYHYHKDNNYQFPDIYQPFIRGTVPYEETGSIYKKYNVFLNVNTVQDSPTMFSCRVFEVLGCGINVVSGYALGIEKMLPEIVRLSKNQNDTIRNLEILMHNKELRDRLSVKGVREVLNNHTYNQRLKSVLDRIGIRYMDNTCKGVTCIVSTNRQKFIDNVFDNYMRQTYEDKELVVVLNKNDMDMERWLEKARNNPSITIYHIDENQTLGACLNFAISKARYDTISKMDDDDYYGPNYLLDLMNTFQYTKADIVGKHAYYIYFEESKAFALKFKDYENCYVNLIAGATLTFKKSVFSKIQFSTDRKAGCDSKFLIDCKQHGFKIYSSDRFNFCVCRRADIKDHTYQIDEEEYLRKCQLIGYVEDFQTHVDI